MRKLNPTAGKGFKIGDQITLEDINILEEWWRQGNSYSRMYSLNQIITHFGNAIYTVKNVYGKYKLTITKKDSSEIVNDLDHTGVVFDFIFKHYTLKNPLDEVF